MHLLPGQAQELRFQFFPRGGKDAVENGPWIGRAPGHIDINAARRKDILYAKAAFTPCAECAAGDGACSYSDDYFGGRRGIPCVQQCLLHVFIDRTGHKDAVRMAWGGRILYAKPPEVVYEGAKHIDICLAGHASAGAYFPQFERPAKKGKVPTGLAKSRTDAGLADV